MAEYIEKQAVITALEKQWNGMVLDVFDFIRSLPSADVQPVVRCKDCKYWEETLNGKGYCKDIIGFGRWWKGNDYCSYGEREDG